MPKLKAKNKDGFLRVSVKLQRGEILAQRDLSMVGQLGLRGLLTPQILKPDTLEYTGPQGISLEELLRRRLNAHVFYDLMAQVVSLERRMSAAGFPVKHLCTELPYIYINPNTLRLAFVYLPLEGGQPRVVLRELMGRIAGRWQCADQPSWEAINAYMTFITRLPAYQPEEILAYIKRCDRQVAERLYLERTSHSGFITDKQADYYKHYNPSAGRPQPAAAPSAAPVVPQAPAAQTAPAAPVAPAAPAAPAPRPAPAAPAASPAPEARDVPLSPMLAALQETTALDEPEALPVPPVPTRAEIETSLPAPGPVPDQADIETALLAPEAAPDPAPAPAPDQAEIETALLAPEAEPEPEPAPAPEPEPAPVFAPVPEPEPAPAPVPVPAPEPTPAPAASPVEETALLGYAGVLPYPYLIRRYTGERISINKPVFRIGKERSCADFYVANNPAISRVHADLLCRNGLYYVRDRNSTNKTFLNGRTLIPEMEIPLHDGDLLQLANEEFEFHLPQIGEDGAGQGALGARPIQ